MHLFDWGWDFHGTGPDTGIQDGLTKKMAATDKPVAALLRDFHIEAAFIGVPKLARILSLAPSTIYGHVRAGGMHSVDAAVTPAHCSENSGTCRMMGAHPGYTEAS